MSRSMIKADTMKFLIKNITHFRNSTFNGNLRSASNLLVNNRLAIDPSTENELNEGMKHKRHSAIMTLKQVDLPSELSSAATYLIDKYPIRDLSKQSEQLANYLWSRHPPAEDDFIQQKAEKLEAEFLKKEGHHIMTLPVDERENLIKKKKANIVSQLRKQIYHWKPVQFDAYRSFLYLCGRFAFDYSAELQIFHEISKRVPNFHPQSVFHFGSGLGSSVWAANSTWPKGKMGTIKEHFCCDPSDDMNTLARLLLQGGKQEAEMCIPGVYFRQFFPPSQKVTYDLVVSSFALNELPSKGERLRAINDLWMKTHKFLVIVENGTNTGFKLVNEARDFILQMSESDKLRYNQEDDSHLQRLGHVFAPCPHDKVCPRVTRQDGTPCNFVVSYNNLSQFSKKKDTSTAKISYVVMRKGLRDDFETKTLPRIVRPVVNPSKCVHVRTCTPSGDLEYSVITTAKHTRDLYWCARACKWGDLLPAIPRPETDEVQADVSDNEINQLQENVSDDVTEHLQADVSDSETGEVESDISESEDKSQADVLDSETGQVESDFSDSEDQPQADVSDNKVSNREQLCTSEPISKPNSNPQQSVSNLDIPANVV